MNLVFFYHTYSIYKAILSSGYRSEEQITEVGVRETIDEINAKISLFGMEIKHVTAEHNGEKHIVLVNTVDNSCILERLVF